LSDSIISLPNTFLLALSPTVVFLMVLFMCDNASNERQSPQRQPSSVCQISTIHFENTSTIIWHVWRRKGRLSYLNKDADSEASYLLQRSDSLHSYTTVIYHLVRHVNAEKQDGFTHTHNDVDADADAASWMP
jgi:hypothetical protein